MKREKRWKRRFVCAALAFALAAGLLAGCGEQQVDYNVGDTEDASGSKTGSMEAYREETDTRWDETLYITDSDGEAVTVTISAYPELPEHENMSVVEVSEYEFSEEHKRAVAEAFFGEEVYSYNLRSLIEAELAEHEEVLGELEGILGNAVGTDYSYQIKRKAKYEAEYEDLQARLADCTDELQTETEFEDSRFIGKNGEIYYILSFEESVTDNAAVYGENGNESIYQKSKCIFIYVEDLLLPEEFTDDDLYGEPSGDSAYSCGEAERMILEKLESAGLGDIAIRSFYTDEDDELMTEDEKRALYSSGYRFDFGFDMLGVDIGSSGSYLYGTKLLAGGDFYRGITENEGYYHYDTYEEAATFELYITDPVEVVSVTSDVPMLSLDEIKKIMVNEIAGGDAFSGYTHGSSISLRYLELTYFPLYDPEHEGYYSYVPVWKLSNGEDKLVVMVNAIDGSVIDLAEELRISGSE